MIVLDDRIVKQAMTNDKCLKAIITNTFPHQPLPNDYHLMEMYGEFYYKENIKK